MRQSPSPRIQLLSGVPILGSGAHSDPEQGACFMEYASLLAGEQFSDRPRCTHPVLAAACRSVNDLTSDEGRQRLVGFVPAVIGTRTHDPRVSATLALTCADRAEPYAPGRFVVARSRAVARLSAMDRGPRWRWWIRCTEPFYLGSAAATAGEAVGTIARAGGDAALLDLLVDLLANRDSVEERLADHNPVRIA